MHNIRAAPEPEEVVETALKAGYVIKRQGYITPEELDLDGHMQVRHVIRVSYSSLDFGLRHIYHA